MSIDLGASYERQLQFPTVFNFRDLGRYRGIGGRTVRWRTVFRADGVHRLSAADLAPLGVRTVVDLRTHGELDERGRFEGDQVAFHHLPLIPHTWEQADLLPTNDAAAYLADRYLDMLDVGGDQLVSAMHLLADPAAVPLVFHCAAGKDRTGVVAAFTLGLLGVADDDIATDYALSGLATERVIDWLRTEYPDKLAEIDAQPTAFLESPIEAMRRFLAAVRDRWGSMEACAASLGIDAVLVQGLRTNLLDS